MAGGVYPAAAVRKELSLKVITAGSPRKEEL